MTEDITTDYYFTINEKFKGVMFLTYLWRILNSPLKQWAKQTLLMFIKMCDKLML